ncbi:1277_t:CDS:1, partial [Cetraspora pellucida]
LYSEIQDAYLSAQLSDHSVPLLWFDNSISNAVNWLKENNSYLHKYSQMILSINNQFPFATHSSVNETTLQF